jgi:flagellar motility protein MotE (MotC chaperone)
MKKAQAYLLVPLVGMIAFGAVYWNFNAGDELRQAAKAAEIKKMRNDKLIEDARLREKAVKDAIASQEKRKAEKEIKDARDRKDREDRENSVQARNKAFRDSEKLQKQVERLKKEVITTKEEIAKIVHVDRSDDSPITTWSCPISAAISL